MNSQGIDDQDYCLLVDGSILAAHGVQLNRGFVTGDIAYLPSSDGPYEIFGNRYQKAYATAGHGIPERRRLLLRDSEVPAPLDSHIYSFKSVVSTSRVEKVLKAQDMIDLASLTWRADVVRSQIDWLSSAFGDRHLAGISIGLTGSLGLLRSEAGRDLPVHDVDLTLTGQVGQIGMLVERIQEYANRAVAARLYEHEKWWRVRVRTPHGILCPFFRYSDVDEWPLRALSRVVAVLDNVTVLGEVADAAHCAFTPSILSVAIAESDSPELIGQSVLVVINHLRDRGEYADGDIGNFCGALVRLEFTDRPARLAVSVVDSADSRNTSPPPWQGLNDLGERYAHCP